MSRWNIPFSYYINGFINFFLHKYLLEFSCIFENTIIKKTSRLLINTVSLVTQNFLECDVKSCYNIISEIWKIALFFQNFKKHFKNLKNVENIQMNFEKS